MNMATRLNGGVGRWRGRLAGAIAMAATVAAAASTRAVIITPTFDSSITSSSQASTIESDINSALQFYNTTLSNAVTVNIYFQISSRDTIKSCGRRKVGGVT